MSTPTCSQCGETRLWRILPFRVPDWHSKFGAPSLPAATVNALTAAEPHASLADPKRLTASSFELRICDRCGFSAWYVRGLDALRKLASDLAAQGRDDIALIKSG